MDEHEQTQEQKPELSWLQVEYISHEKSSQWYMAFLAVFMVSAIIIFFATSSIFSLLVILLAAIAGLVYANKPPERVEYSLYLDGFSVNSRQYYFDEFRSFSPIVEKNIKGVVLNPTGRLKLPMNLYFSQESEEQAYDLLENSLVLESYNPDILQKLVDFIRF